jgi:predicted RNA-binding Zn ribbon-like protein
MLSMDGNGNAVKRGGKWTPKGFLFELTGGNLALDFVNTLDMRPLPSRTELLSTYTDASAWARQVGLITAKEESELNKAAARRPEKARAARQRFVEARECLFRVLLAVVDGERIPEKTLEHWNRLVHRAMERFELERRDDRLAWRNAADPRELDSFLWPVIHAAVTLLTGPDVGRIRRCASEKCDWMFLDRSKRGNRRWCDMTVCGNRAKAQRFYQRKKKGAVTK